MEQFSQILSKLNEIISLQNIITALVALIVCFVIIKIIIKMTNAALEKCHIDKTLHTFIKSAIKILLYIIMAIIIAGTLGIEISSMIALLSVAGLAVSLAVQDSLSNAASGITILITKPFVKGDFIEISDISGTVDSVGITNTCIRTIDNKMIFVPNSTVCGANIINYSHEETRRIDIKISASYNNSTEAVKKALLCAANMSQEKILNDPPVFVALSGYGESSVEYLIRFWVASNDYWDVYFKVLEDIRICFDENNIEMTYNHIIIHEQK